jgi:hypothetical protein
MHAAARTGAAGMPDRFETPNVLNRAHHVSEAISCILTGQFFQFSLLPVLYRSKLQ